MPAPVGTNVVSKYLRPYLAQKTGVRPFLTTLAVVLFAQLTGCVFAVEPMNNANRPQRDAAADTGPEADVPRLDVADASHDVVDATVVDADVPPSDTPDAFVPDVVTPDTVVVDADVVRPPVDASDAFVPDVVNPDTVVVDADVVVPPVDTPDAFVPDSLPPVDVPDVPETDARDSSVDPDVVEVEVGDGGVGVCPRTYIADFSRGMRMRTVVNSGIVSLDRDNAAWNCYRASSGVFPDRATPAWTENAPSGWVSKEFSSGMLHLSSLGRVSRAAYEIATPSITGDFLVEARVRLVDSSGSVGCGIDIRNGSREVRFSIQNSRVLESLLGLSIYSMDPRVDFNVYRITQQGSDYSVYVNGALRLSGTSPVVTSPSQISFHDLGTGDAEALWDYICWYPAASLPYAATGTFTSEIIDAGLGNNIGRGAIFSWSPVLPMGTNLTMQICASNDSAMAGAVCASDLTSSGGMMIPSMVMGRYVRWSGSFSATDTTQTSQLRAVSMSYNNNCL